MRYNERFVEELHLPVEELDFGQAKPQMNVSDSSAGHAWPPVARPVLQQDLPNLLPPLVTSTALKLMQVLYNSTALRRVLSHASLLRHVLHKSQSAVVC